MASDARKHTVPVGTDPVDLVGVVGGLSASIRDIIQVDNTTARAALVDALTTAGMGPSATNPLYVHRTDALSGRELERTTDGTTWWPIVSSQSGLLALALGTVTFPAIAVGNSASVVVTFPAGRFSRPPDVVGGFNRGTPRLTFFGFSVTQSQFTLQAANWSDAASASGPANWLAIEGS
jgi:hypothetical protein